MELENIIMQSTATVFSAYETVVLRRISHRRRSLNFWNPPAIGIGESHWHFYTPLPAISALTISGVQQEALPSGRLCKRKLFFPL